MAAASALSQLRTQQVVSPEQHVLMLEAISHGLGCAAVDRASHADIYAVVCEGCARAEQDSIATEELLIAAAALRCAAALCAVDSTFVTVDICGTLVLPALRTPAGGAEHSRQRWHDGLALLCMCLRQGSGAEGVLVRPHRMIDRAFGEEHTRDSRWPTCGARIASFPQLLAPPPLLCALVECACVPIRDVLCDSALDDGSDDRVKPLCDMLKTVSMPDVLLIAATLRLMVG